MVDELFKAIGNSLIALVVFPFSIVSRSASRHVASSGSRPAAIVHRQRVILRVQADVF